MFYCIYFFIIGALAGWILECVFKAITHNFDRAPGILYSPFCILYGIGTLLLSTIIPMVTENVLLLFLISAIVLTFCEYVTYELLQKMYGIQLWDYSDMKLALNEKVCIEFAAIWGILGVLYIRYLMPILRGVYFEIDGAISNLIIFALFIFIALDLLYTNDKLIRRQELHIDKYT